MKKTYYILSVIVVLFLPIFVYAVELYSKYPFTGENLLASREIQGIGSNGVDSSLFGVNTDITISQGNESSSEYIYLIVDPNNSLEEIEEDNNFIAIRNTVTKFANLRVTTDDLQFTNNEDGTISVEATVHNIGDSTAFFVDVGLFDFKGNRIGTKYIDYIEPHDNKKATFSLRDYSGSYTISADKEYDLNELKRNDNEAEFNSDGIVYNIQCNNGSEWLSCSKLRYNHTITQVKATCLNASYAEFILTNNYDHTTFFDNITYININEEWILNNRNIVITDSGEWELLVKCSDNSQGSSKWNVAWGSLQPYLKQPNTNINVTRYLFFNFTSGVKCIGGECTNITAGLDPVSNPQSSEEGEDNKELLEQISKNQEIPVIIVLQDKPSLQIKTKDDLALKKKIIKDTQNEFLGNLNYVFDYISDGEAVTSRLDNKEPIDFKLKYKYDAINAIAGKLTKEGFLKLQDNPMIKRIYLDKVHHIFLSESVPMIRANDSWALGYTGKGQTACIIDTGIDYRHPDLGNCTSSTFLAGTCSKVIWGYDYHNVDSNPIDDNNHGTHVAGIVAANGAIKGVAPDAKLVALKVCDSTGQICYTSDIQAAFDWCINNASKFNISVISLSLGKDQTAYKTYCNNDDLAYVINTAVGQNIAVAAAAGNKLGSNGIGSPACVENATSVGGVDDNDAIVYKYGRSQILDLLAPAINIYSTVRNGVYMEKDGTSMATPHVSGSVLLLKEYNNSLTPAEIETLLKDTGIEVYDAQTNLTFPRIDVYNALTYLINKSSPKEGVTKGMISTDPTAIPFYTPINPMNSANVGCLANLKAGESCEQTWSVKASGYINSTYEFFTIYTSQHPEMGTTQTETVETEKINISISSFSLIKFNLTLHTGWNLISIPLELQNKTVKNVFWGISYTAIFTHLNSKWQELDNNSLINETKGYWIDSLGNQVLTIEGIELQNVTPNLNKGWSLIGYPSLNISLINETLKDINYSIVYSYNNSKWYSYNPNKPDYLNTLQYMYPGYGYWVRVD